MKVDLLFPFLLLSLLLLDAIDSLMKVEDYRQKRQPVSSTINNKTDQIKPTHRCGHDQKSSVVPPTPVILQTMKQIIPNIYLQIISPDNCYVCV